MCVTPGEHGPPAAIRPAPGWARPLDRAGDRPPPRRHLDPAALFLASGSHTCRAPRLAAARTFPAA
jgi:hypothetical protein